MQTFSTFSGSVYHFFRHLTRRCFAKLDPETGVCYLLRGRAITGVWIIKGIIGEREETMISGNVQLPCLIDVCICASFSATS